MMKVMMTNTEIKMVVSLRFLVSIVLGLHMMVKNKLLKNIKKEEEVNVDLGKNTYVQENPKDDPLI